MKFTVRFFTTLLLLLFISMFFVEKLSLAESVQPYQGETEIKPYQETTEVQPYQGGTEIKPYQAESVQPYQGETEIKPYQETTEVQPYQGETEIKRFEPGVDISANQSAFDKAIVGKWAAYIPNMAWSDRKDYGNTVVDTTHVAQGAAFGIIQIFKDGRFIWKNRNKTISQGKLLRVIPKSDATEGETYWGILKDNYGQYYIQSYSDGGISLYGVNTHMYAYGLKRVK